MDKDTIRLIVGVVVMFGVFLFGYNRGLKRATISEDTKVDTLYVCDTIVHYEPLLEERIVLEKEPYPVTDTLRIRDTLYMYLEREQVMWEDSLSRVYASGIAPQIDSVSHFVRERVVTKEQIVHVKERSKWGIGIHAGYGLSFGNQVTTSPYIGVGVTYNLLSW